MLNPALKRPFTRVGEKQISRFVAVITFKPVYGVFRDELKVRKINKWR